MAPADSLPASSRPPAIPATPVAARQLHLDWLRGVAVVIMITGHAIDSWTSPGERQRPLFVWTLIVAGGGSALFLFLAGVASTLAVETRARRLGGAGAAAMSVQRRGWQIFLYAFLFRLQSFVLNPRSTAVGLLRVDVLNIMGPSIVATAALWRTAHTAGVRVLVLGVATAAFALVTPLVRSAEWPALLPDPIEWYLRPSPGHTNFTLLPWAGFVTAGGVVGLWLHHARERGLDTRAHVWMALAGAGLAALGWLASWLPSPYAASSFWTSSPAFFCLRAGLLMMCVSGAYAWVHRGEGLRATAPLCRLGLSSLFVYWIHVEMVYGVLSRPLHRNLSLPAAYVAITAFTLLMLALVRVKEDVVARWRGRRPALVSSEAKR